MFSCYVATLCFCGGTREDTSSLRLLSNDRSGRQIIKKFSLRQRLHLLLELLLDVCRVPVFCVTE